MKIKKQLIQIGMIILCVSLTGCGSGQQPLQIPQQSTKTDAFQNTSTMVPLSASLMPTITKITTSTQTLTPTMMFPTLELPTTITPVPLVAGLYFTCALTRIGGVKCWGDNESGALGIGGSWTDKFKLVPVDVFGLSSGVAALAAGYNHACALTLQGGVKCWGWYLLGMPHDLGGRLPDFVPGLTSGVVAITAGDGHTCVLMKGGAVKCWGNNEFGQLGNGTTQDSVTPTDVIGLTGGVVAVAAGLQHTCALMITGGVNCWGAGNGDVPKGVSDLPDGIVALSAGGDHTCVLTNQGAAYCWGSNSSHELGETAGIIYTPTEVNGLTSGIASITLGGTHICAMTTNGGVKCMGRGAGGQD